MVRIYARNVPRVHGHKRLDDNDTVLLIAASTMDWSKCAHSIFTKMQTKIIHS